MRHLSLGDVARPSLAFKLFASPQTRLRRHAFLADDMGLTEVGNHFHTWATKGQLFSFYVLACVHLSRMKYAIKNWRNV